MSGVCCLEINKCFNVWFLFLRELYGVWLKCTDCCVLQNSCRSSGSRPDIIAGKQSSSNASPHVLLDAIVLLFVRAMPLNKIASQLFLHCQSRSAIMVDCCHVVDFARSIEKGRSLISNCPPLNYCFVSFLHSRRWNQCSSSFSVHSLTSNFLVKLSLHILTCFPSYSHTRSTLPLPPQINPKPSLIHSHYPECEQGQSDW